MKQLAICISGSLRSLEYCIDNFINNVYEPNKENFNITLFYFLPDDINSKKIDLLNKLNPVIKIEKDIEHPNLNILWIGTVVVSRDNVSTGGIKGYIQQLYGIEQSFIMVEDYEIENNIEFNVILRCRSDVIFTEPVYINKYDLNNIIVPSFIGDRGHGINDRFAFGNRNIMKVYMNMYSNIYKITKNKIKLNYKKVKKINAEMFCEYNLDFHNIKYTSCNNIHFKRVRMGGTILNDLNII